jgi:hypothetical protein
MTFTKTETILFLLVANLAGLALALSVIALYQ